MGNKKSQVKIQNEEQNKDHEKFKENAENFFKEYTALTDKYGVMLDAKLEFEIDGISPKIVMVKKPIVKDEPTDVATDEVK